MQSIETTPMPVNLRQIARRAVLKHKGYSEQTLETIEQARKDGEAQRAQLVKDTDGAIEFGPDGEVRLSPKEKAAIERRRCLEAIERVAQLVQEWGSARVSLWVTAAAVQNGEKLR